MEESVEESILLCSLLYSKDKVAPQKQDVLY